MASPEFEALEARIREAAERSGARGARLDVEKMRSAARSPWPIPSACHAWEVRACGVRSHWVCARGSDPGRRLLYLHGGGYVAGGFASHGTFAALLSEAAGCPVLLPEYRLAPEHRFPAALDDAVAAYRFMLENGPAGPGPAAAAFAAGDSSGGGLALALLLALRDGGGRLPDAALAFSPFTDLTCSGESMRTRAAADVAVGPELVPEAAALYCGGAARDAPLVSPLFGELAGLPPLLLQVGDSEVLLSDSTRFAERAGAAGVDVSLDVWPEMFHGFQLWAPILPEGERALRRAAAFIRGRAAGVRE